MAEEVKDTAPVQGPATKSYVLVKGKKHQGIVDGEMVTVVGDGKIRFDLTEGQAKAFGDKFIIPDDDADVDPVTQSADDINRAAQETGTGNEVDNAANAPGKKADEKPAEPAKK